MTVGFTQLLERLAQTTVLLAYDKVLPRRLLSPKTRGSPTAASRVLGLQGLGGLAMQQGD